MIIFNSNYKVDEVNDVDDADKDAVNDANDEDNDAVSDAVSDTVNDAVSDAVNNIYIEIDNKIINCIKKYPGLRVPSIYNLIKQNIPNITINIIRNRIRRELKDQIIFIGNFKTGGYFIKNKR